MMYALAEIMKVLQQHAWLKTKQEKQEFALKLFDNQESRISDDRLTAQLDSIMKQSTKPT